MRRAVATNTSATDVFRDMLTEPGGPDRNIRNVGP